MSLPELSKQHIRPLLKLNDQLRTLSAAENDINVTSIVAVGDQSSGKTSLIEALSGVDLPRGEGIQTRVPLVLMLREARRQTEAAGNTPGIADSDAGREYAEIRWGPEEAKKVELTKIADAVRECTAAIAGNSSDVKDVAVELTVYRHDQDDLTLIDLPGMTRVAIEGQHSGIEETIRNMYSKYMKPEETVLLNVVSAMADVTTSASLKMSLDFDTKSVRTMVCVTKVDQHKEPGLATKIHDISEKLKIPTNHVFVVRNRSQPENDKGMPLGEVRALEESYFSSCEDLSSLLDSQKGVSALSRRLTILQSDRIRKTLPQVARMIKARAATLKTRAHKLDSRFGHISSEGMCQSHFARAVSDLKTAVQADFEGHGSIRLFEDDPDLSLCESEDDFGNHIIGQQFTMPQIPAVHIQKKSIGIGDTGLYVEVKTMGENLEYIRTCDMILKGNDTVESVQVEGIVSAEGLRQNRHMKEDFFVNTWISAEGNSLLESFPDSSKGDKCIIKSLQSCTFVVTGVKRCTKDGDARDQCTGTNMACAEVHAGQQRLVSKISTMYSNMYFFSSAMRDRLRILVNQRRGASGMPGSTGPEPALEIMKELLKHLPRLSQGHVSQLSKTVHERCLYWLDRLGSLDDFPRAKEACRNVFETKVEEHTKRASEYVNAISAWETSQIITHNHYFMNTVQSIRAAVSKVGSDDIPKRFDSFLSPGYVKQLKQMSNEDQKLWDLQVELYCYWKTMKKRVSDYVPMATRYHLVEELIFRGCLSDPLKASVFDEISNQMNALAKEHGGYMALRHVDSSHLAEIANVKKRLEKLEDAIALIDKVVNSEEGLDQV